MPTNSIPLPKSWRTVQEAHLESMTLWNKQQWYNKEKPGKAENKQTKMDGVTERHLPNTDESIVRPMGERR